MAMATRATVRATRATMMATRMTATRATTVAEMTANGNKKSVRVHNNQLSHQQKQGLLQMTTAGGRGALTIVTIIND